MKKTEVSPHKLQLRYLRSSDYPDMENILRTIYPADDEVWTGEQFESMIARFPEGQICIEDRGKVVAAALSLIIRWDKFSSNPTFPNIVGDGHLRNHDPDGDYLYGFDTFVHPDYREMRLGRRLYDARKELCEQLNLKGILVGGRISHYEAYDTDMSAEEYVRMVKRKEIYDPVLTFQFANDFHTKALIKDFTPSRAGVREYPVLLEWNNIFYSERPRLIGGKKKFARLGVVQWQMRRFHSFEDFLQQVEFFVDTVSGYQSDLVLFPEFFNAPLMGELNQEEPAEAVRSLAEYSTRLRDELLEMAVSYNINIVAGSCPEYQDQKLHNLCYLLRRDGTWDKQYKLHCTPDEIQYWGLQGGNQLKVFDTDVGKIGILICFDVEFPELSRYLVDQGMKILLVPYWTDTKNAYLRVRRCAQARAIENECYVAISGSVGNIPKIENMDIQYSQSAVFTPSDFAFPHDAIAAEATPNTEMTLVVDLDLELLDELRQQGSVRNLQNRRLDLYNVVWKKKNQQ